MEEKKHQRRLSLDFLMEEKVYKKRALIEKYKKPS